MELTVRRLGAGLLALIATAGCKNPFSPDRDVTYHAMGSGRADITYEASPDSTSQRNDVTLPWNGFMSGAKKTDFVYVSAQKDGSAGCITVEIRVDNKVEFSGFSCGPFAIATASGTLD